jgi:peptidyl-prolyl cis-trans isomerase SDCCAG10
MHYTCESGLLFFIWDVFESMQNSSEGETTRDVQLSVKEALSSKKGNLSVKEAPGSKKEAPRRDSAAVFSNSDDDDEDDALFYSGMRQQIIQKGKELGDLPPKLKQNGTVTLYSTFSFDEFSQH